MDNSKADKIMKLDKKIENIALKTTSFYNPGEKQNLNDYDKQVIKYYQEILNLICEIAKEDKTKDIETIGNRYFKTENTASMMIESYIAILQFYGNIDKEIRKKEIEILQIIQKNLQLDKNFEMTNKIELADSYFHIGDERKARELMLNFIKENPNEDESYMCMQNWYMYDKPDINKLAEVINLAEKNKHTLITDFGYDRLVEFYTSIGDTDNKQKYEELYNKWKENRKTIEF